MSLLSVINTSSQSIGYIPILNLPVIAGRAVVGITCLVVGAVARIIVLINLKILKDLPKSFSEPNVKDYQICKLNHSGATATTIFVHGIGEIVTGIIEMVPFAKAIIKIAELSHGNQSYRFGALNFLEYWTLHRGLDPTLG